MTAIVKPMGFDPNARAEVPEHVFSREFGDELVLLDLDGGEYFALNEVGAALFRGLAGGRSVRETAHALEGAYEVEAAQLFQDLVALADALASRGLIRAIP